MSRFSSTRHSGRSLRGYVTTSTAVCPYRWCRALRRPAGSTRSRTLWWPTQRSSRRWWLVPAHSVLGGYRRSIGRRGGVRHPPGAERRERQKAVAKLYDKRSAAVHGLPKHDNEDIFETFALMREVLVRIVDHGKVPTRDMLEAALFGWCRKLHSLSRDSGEQESLASADR